MPYGNDEWLEKSKKEFLQAQVRVAKEYEAQLRSHLKAKFNVSNEFMDLAVRVWKDGKED